MISATKTCFASLENPFVCLALCGSFGKGFHHKFGFLLCFYIKKSVFRVSRMSSLIVRRYFEVDKSFLINCSWAYINPGWKKCIPYKDLARFSCKVLQVNAFLCKTSCKYLARRKFSVQDSFKKKRFLARSFQGEKFLARFFQGRKVPWKILLRNTFPCKTHPRRKIPWNVQRFSHIWSFLFKILCSLDALILPKLLKCFDFGFILKS